MGDERQPDPEPPAAAAPGSGTGRRRDSDADRASAASAPAEPLSHGGGEPARTEAATTASPIDGAGLGDGTSAATETSSASGAAAEATQADVEGLSLDDLESHALRGIRYHEDRGSFLDLMRRVLDFAVVALGTAAVASLFAEKSTGAVVLNVGTALVGALQLVCNLGDKAQEHRWARRKFCDLLARVTEAKQGSTDPARTLRKLTKRWTEIWGDEAATMYVLEAIAHNATARALHREIDPDDLIEIPFVRSVFRNWCAQEGFENLTAREKREAAAKKAAAKT